MSVITFNLLISGQMADIDAGTSLGIKRQNMSFNYGDIQLSRTQEFHLPLTPRNNAIFALASRVETAPNASAAWHPVAAQLQYAGGVTDGTLFVSEVSGGYSAVFIYSDLPWLRTASDAGEVRDTFIDRDMTGQARPSSVAHQPTATWSPDVFAYDRLSYQNNVDNAYNLTVSIVNILMRGLGNYGVAVDTSTFPKLAYLSNSYGSMPSRSVSLWWHANGVVGQSSPGITIPVDRKTVPFQYSPYNTQTVQISVLEPDFGGESTESGGELWTITLPDDFPDNLCLVRLPHGDTFDVNQIIWFGGRRVDIDPATGTKTYSGEPLAGRTINMKAMPRAFSYLGIVSADTTVAAYRENQPPSNRYYLGGFNATASVSPREYIIEVGKSDVWPSPASTANNVTRCGQIPEGWTWLSLLNVCRNYAGKRLVVNGSTLSLRPYDFASWRRIEPDVVSIESIKRGLSVASNTDGVTIDYDDNDDVSRIAKMEARTDFGITINGDVKDLYRFPLSFGSKMNDGKIKVDDLEKMDDGRWRQKNGKPTLVVFGEDGALYQARAAGIDSDREDFTAFAAGGWVYIRAKVLMSMHVFVSLADDVLININGSDYVWTDGTWAKGVATLTLQRVLF